MWNISTQKNSIARDITRLNKIYTEYLEHERNKQISDESYSSIPINKEEESASTTTKSSEEDSSELLKDMLPPETVVSENAKISLNSESSNEHSDDSSNDLTVRSKKLQRELKALGVNIDIPVSNRIIRSRTRAKNLINIIIDANNDSDLNEIAYFINDEEDRRSVNTLIEELEEIWDTKKLQSNDEKTT